MIVAVTFDAIRDIDETVGCHWPVHAGVHQVPFAIRTTRKPGGAFAVLGVREQAF